MKKLNNLLDNFNEYVESEQFEKKCDKVGWWIIGLSFSYFTIRTVLSIVWDI